MKFLLGLGLLCMLAPSAFAQEAQPCQRGQSTMRMNGMDVEEMKCVQWLTQQQLGQMIMTEQHLKAQILFQFNDLKATQKQLADTLEYAKACGDKPGCFIPVEE